MKIKNRLRITLLGSVQPRREHCFTVVFYSLRRATPSAACRASTYTWARPVIRSGNRSGDWRRRNSLSLKLVPFHQHGRQQGQRFLSYVRAAQLCSTRTAGRDASPSTANQRSEIPCAPSSSSCKWPTELHLDSYSFLNTKRDKIR